MFSIGRAQFEKIEFSLFRPKVSKSTFIALKSILFIKEKKFAPNKSLMTSVTIEETRVTTQKIVSAVFSSSEGMILLFLLTVALFFYSMLELFSGTFF